jgi:hypothetical protein
MVITVYSPIPLSLREIERRMQRCPFAKDATKIQVLERKSADAITEWAKEQGLKVVQRKMNIHHGKGAIFRTYKSIVQQCDGIAFLGRPMTELDYFVISRVTREPRKKLWIAA